MDRFASCLSFPPFSLTGGGLALAIEGPDQMRQRQLSLASLCFVPTLFDEAPHNAKKVISASFSYHDKIADHEMLYRQYGCGCLRSRAVDDPTGCRRGGFRQVKDPCIIGSAESF